MVWFTCKLLVTVAGLYYNHHDDRYGPHSPFNIVIELTHSNSNCIIRGLSLTAIHKCCWSQTYKSDHFQIRVTKPRGLLDASHKYMSIFSCYGNHLKRSKIVRWPSCVQCHRMEIFRSDEGVSVPVLIIPCWSWFGVCIIVIIVITGL